MRLAGRLKQLESKVRPDYAIQEHDFDLDRWIEQLGLVPTVVREMANSKGSSLIEAVCEMLGIEAREFKNELREAVNLVR